MAFEDDDPKRFITNFNKIKKFLVSSPLKSYRTSNVIAELNFNSIVMICRKTLLG